MQITQVLMKDPLLVASWRLLETSLIVTGIGVLGTLQIALTTPGGIDTFNWHGALTSLIVGVISGVVNAALAYLNALKKQNEANAAGSPTIIAPKGP